MTFRKWYMIRKEKKPGQHIFKDANLENELQIYGVNISSWRVFISFLSPLVPLGDLRAVICKNDDV